MAEFTQKHWISWIDSGDAAYVYQKEHLPHIAIKYASIWDVKFDPTANISPSVLDQIKGEIIDLLVRMHVLPRSYGRAAERNSLRMVVNGDLLQFDGSGGGDLWICGGSCMNQTKIPMNQLPHNICEKTFPGKFKIHGKWPKFGMAISQSIWILWRLPLQYPTPHNLKILQINYQNIFDFLLPW
jgi:hypothetical protein